MTTEVKIAPVERWCDDVQSTLRKNPRMAKMVGLPIDLVVGKVSKTLCSVNGKEREFRRFYATPESLAALHEFIGGYTGYNSSGTICEHMLEMD